MKELIIKVLKEHQYQNCTYEFIADRIIERMNQDKIETDLQKVILKRFLVAMVTELENHRK